MRWQIANKVHSAELTNNNQLISSKRKCNNCFIKNASKYRNAPPPPKKKKKYEYSRFSFAKEYTKAETDTT